MGRRSAFTILEIVLVLAIVVIVAAIGWPSIESAQDEFRVSAAIDQVRSAWAEARARAAEDNIAYRFAVKLDSGQYRIAPDAGEFWGTGENSNSIEIDTPPLVHEDSLPPGVTVAEVVNGGGQGDWQTVATFQSDGTARENAVELILRAPYARPARIHLRGLTASVTVSREGG